jgi:hypothetical protein
MHSPEPVPTNAFDALAATTPVAEARFMCARHGTEAGVVRLHGSEAAGWMAVVDSFVSSTRQTIGAPEAEALRDALTRADVRAIYRLDLEWAPFYCAECGVSYCGQCWRTMPVFDPDFPGWLEELRGTCPEDHERMLSD